MATISDLVGKLKLRAKVTPEERLSSSASLDDFIAEIIEDAITFHNPSLTVETLPAAEEQLVLILGQIEIAYVRAEKFVNDAAVEAGGGTFSIQADSPFNKNIKLAAELSKRYDILVKQLGVSSGSVDIVVQTTAYKKSDRLDAIFPYFTAPAAPVPLLTASLDTEDPDTSIILDWENTAVVDYFHRYWLFWAPTPGVFEAWNAVGKMTVPRIKSSAVLLFDTYDPFQKAIKAEDFDPDTDQYFMLVSQTKTNKYTYSNEVYVKTAA